MKDTRVCSSCSKEKTILRTNWYANNECSACHAKVKYANSNRNETKKAWRLINKEECLKKNREYVANKKKTDINFKLKLALRKRLAMAIKYDQKTGSAVDDLGCSVQELKIYLESKFQEGMTWENYSYRGWHIDHVKPLSSFDLTDLEQLKQACHYSNLQPLWAKDNFKKSDNYE